MHSSQHYIAGQDSVHQNRTYKAATKCRNLGNRWHQHAKFRLHYSVQMIYGRLCMHSMNVQERLGIDKSCATHGGNSMPLADGTRGLAKQTWGCQIRVWIRGDELSGRKRHHHHLCVQELKLDWRSSLPARAYANA